MVYGSLYSIVETENSVLFKIYSFDTPGVYTLNPYCTYMSGETLYRVDGTPVKITVTEEGWTDVLDLPDDLTRIEDSAFYGGAFRMVIIPDSCTSIGSMAFAYCPNLRYVSYKEGTVIADDAFEGSDMQVLEGR